MMCKVDYQTYSVQAVANYILRLAASRNMPVTNLKMQKLVYFAQGYALACLKHPLFNDEIQAWRHGPVVPALYHDLKRFGSGDITGTLSAPDCVPEDSDAAGVIKQVMDDLGSYTAVQLVELSHMPDTPWDAAWTGARFSRIPLWQMSIYFSELATA